MRTLAFELPRASAGQRLLAVVGVIVAALLLMGALAGCRMSVDQQREGKSEKVNIETPFFSLGVRTNEAEAKDVGLPEYPGARRQKEHAGEKESAKVSIQMGGFGLKVVAIAYESDDPRDKVLAFYRAEMKKMGNLVECQGDIDVDLDKHDPAASREPGCKPDRSHPDKIELAVRVGGGNRIVSVRPKGKGTEFSLIYLQTHGESDTI